MIVIQRRQRVHVGQGLASSLFKRLASRVSVDGTKKAIKRAANSAIAHKVANAVVNGAVNATEKLVEDTIVKKLKTSEGSGIIFDHQQQ